jgi:hypothetical protein
MPSDVYNGEANGRKAPPDRSLRTPQPPSLVALTLQRRRLTHALQQPRDER